MRNLPESAAIKLELLFSGVRYTPALGEAAEGALPNYYPYRFAEGEEDPTGSGQAVIPYLMSLDDDTLIRVKGNHESLWSVEGDGAGGYVLVRDGELGRGVRFQQMPDWMTQSCEDGTPMARVGASLHGDMLVVNPTPGCQYFPARRQFGRRMRCAFCLYGKPADWQASLGQSIDEPLLPDWALRRLQETVSAAVASGEVRHVYLVGGSMVDPNEEAARYLQLARAMREGCSDIPYLTCGSSALPDEALEELRGEGLVDGVCFNLEVFGRDLFELVCPGKAHSVGYEGWIASLERAVDLFGEGNVYSAMVSGIELEPRYGDMSVDDALDRAEVGVAMLLERGIHSILSLYWPLQERGSEKLLSSLRSYFAELHLRAERLRRERNSRFNEIFMCHRCSYMQLECDLDRLPGCS